MLSVWYYIGVARVTPTEKEILKMRKLEGYELVEFVSNTLSDTVGAKVEYHAVVFNHGIHLDTYINGTFIQKRKFADYDALEQFLHEVLENIEKGN